jgi:hypothetical protein
MFGNNSGRPKTNWGDDIGPRVAISAGRGAVSGISGCVVSIVISVFVFLMILCGSGATAYMIMSAPAGMNSTNFDVPGAEEKPEWNGKQTFECGGIDNVTLEGKKVKMKSGVAIEAGGNCKLTLVDMKITAPNTIKVGGNASVTIKGGKIKASETAIKVGGNGSVTIRGGTVEGETLAVEAGGNGQVTVKDGGKVVGKVETSANGKVTGIEE